MLTLPLWIVTEHIQPSDAENIAETVPGTALAFSTSGRLFKFLATNQTGKWKMEMAADRDGLVILIADLHRLEIREFSLDPHEEDGTGGESLQLSALIALADSLR